MQSFFLALQTEVPCIRLFLNWMAFLSLSNHILKHAQGINPAPSDLSRPDLTSVSHRISFLDRGGNPRITI